MVLQNPNSTDAQRDEALKDMDNADPNYGREFAKDAERKDGELGNKVEKTSMANADKLSQRDDLYDNLTKAQTTGTTASFNAEVNVASNDIEPQVKIAELAPAPF